MNQATGSLPLAGRRAIVAVHGAAFGSALALGLRRNGAQVVEASTAFDSLDAAKKCLGDAAQHLGGVDLVLHACASAAALVSRSLDSLSSADWNAALHRNMLATLFCLQAAHASLRER